MANNEVDDVESLTDLTATQNNNNRWAPRFFKVHHQLDFLEFVSVARGLNPPLVPIFRMLSNRDIHIYGEFVMHDGAIRSFHTVGITCLTAGEAILSLRTGSAVGDEVARFTQTGQLRLITAPQTAAEPALVLDATLATTLTGNSWKIASDPTTGNLQFVYATGGATTVYAEMSGGGSFLFALRSVGAIGSFPSGGQGTIVLKNNGVHNFLAVNVDGSNWESVQLS